MPAGDSRPGPAGSTGRSALARKTCGVVIEAQQYEFVLVIEQAQQYEFVQEVHRLPAASHSLS